MSETTTLTRTEAAAVLGVGERSMFNLEKQGSLIPRRVGTRVVYDRAEVEAYRDRRSHRVILRDEDFAQFRVNHGTVPNKGEGSRKSERLITLSVRCPGPGDRDVVLTPDTWAAILLLAQAGGYPSSQLEALPELGIKDGTKLAAALESAVAVAALLRRGRGAKLGWKNAQL